jgi:hypothetical protein
MSLALNLKRPHAGVDHTTLTGVKRVTVPDWSSSDTFGAGLDIVPPYPDENAIGVNQQASTQNVDGPITTVYKAIPYGGDPGEFPFCRD